MTTRRISWGRVVLVAAVTLAIVGIGYYFIVPAMRHNDASPVPSTTLPYETAPPICSAKVWPECVPPGSTLTEKPSSASTPVQETVLPNIKPFDPPVPPEVIRYMVDNHANVGFAQTRFAQWMNVEGRMDGSEPTHKSCLMPAGSRLTPLGVFNGRALAAYGNDSRNASPDACTDGDVGFFSTDLFVGMPGWYR